MAIFRVVHTYKDIQEGVTTRRYEGDFADYAAARSAADDLLADVQAATKSSVIREELTEVSDISGAIAANTTVFERVDATVLLDGRNKKYGMSFPNPVDAIMAGNALKPAEAIWVNLMANFASGAWYISDRDHYSATVAGERAYAKSGKTNLPS